MNPINNCSLTSYKYNLPFVTSLRTHKTTFNHREGIILEYSTPELTYYGEAAPLPGFSTETLDEVQEQLEQYHRLFLDILTRRFPVDDMIEMCYDKEIVSSLRFALDSLAYQLEARQYDKSLLWFLSFKHQVNIPLNALISLDTEHLLYRVGKLIENGFYTLKAKIGLDIESEYLKLKKIRALFPDLSLRLDANQAWSIDEAIEILKDFEELNIEYCEEPLQDYSSLALEKLSANTKIPIALDESVQLINWKEPIHASVLILKPMVLGSFSTFFAIRHIASRRGVRSVVTTSLESAVGRTMTAILTTTSKDLLDTAHGLNTGSFLAEDTFDDKAQLNRGTYYIASEPLWNNVEKKHLQSLAINTLKYP